MSTLCSVLSVQKHTDVRKDKVSTNNGEGPPVPIPNTEVKLIGGENTCLATDREDSTVPTQMFLNSSVGRARGC